MYTWHTVFPKKRQGASDVNKCCIKLDLRSQISYSSTVLKIFDNNFLGNLHADADLHQNTQVSRVTNVYKLCKVYSEMG